MAIQSVSNSNTYTQSAATVNSAAAEANQAVTAEETEVAAVYEKSQPSGTSKTYDAKIAAQVKSAMNTRTTALKQLVEQLLTTQGKNSKFLKGVQDQLTMEDITPAQAQELIGEDGYYGVKQTSERILDMAKGFANADPEVLEKMAAAIEKGFELAKQALGGSLPGICQETYEAVKKGLDELRQSMQPTAASE